MRNILDKVVEKVRTHSLCSVTFSPAENRAVYDNVEKCGTADKDTGKNMVHEHFTVDNYSYKHIHRICNNYWFFHGYSS
jgi:hypothetical protein